MPLRFRHLLCPGVLLASLTLAPSAHASGSAKSHAAAGAQLFGVSGCTHCHGDNGQGTDLGPSLIDAGKRLKPEQMSRQIREGGQVMPAFGAILTGDQIEDLVAFLRAGRTHAPHAPGAHSGR